MGGGVGVHPEGDERRGVWQGGQGHRLPPYERGSVARTSQTTDSTAMRPLGQALIRSLRRTGGAEDTRPARPTDPIQGTRPVDPRVRPAERAPRPSSSQWIYSACLCFGLDADEQARSGFGYAYSVYQAEYRRNLLFGSGAQMDRVVNTLVARTRSRLDVPMLRTLFGAKRRPGLGGSADLSPRLAAVIETPRWDLTPFKVHF